MKKNLLFMVPQLTGGGGERILANLTLAFSENYNVHILTFYSKENFTYNYSGELTELKTFPSKNPIKKLVNFVNRIITIRKIKKEKNIDVSISFIESANVLNVLTRYKDKVILTIHCHMSTVVKDKGLKALPQVLFAKCLYNHSDYVVAVSKAIGTDLIENFNLKNEKLKVIYNPIEINEIQEKSKATIDNEYNDIFKHKTIITIGRLTRQKAQWHLIRMFKKLNNDLPDSKLVILGDGELRDYLIDLSKKLGLKVYSAWENTDTDIENFDIYFLGFQDNPFKYLSKATVFALTSLFEGLPTVIIEALTCNIPVISSDCNSGPREILAPDTDINYKANNAEYAKYGVLMPVCDGNLYSHEEALTTAEEIWVNELKNILTSDDICRQYTDLSKKRIQDFDKTISLNTYEDLFNS